MKFPAIDYNNIIMIVHVIRGLRARMNNFNECVDFVESKFGEYRAKVHTVLATIIQ